MISLYAILNKTTYNLCAIAILTIQVFIIDTIVTRDFDNYNVYTQ